MRESSFLRGAAALLIGASSIALLPMPARAQAQAEAPQPINETNRYPMRLMMQVFDGSREFSHSQVAGFARMRQGDESWIAVNFGDGAVVVDQGNRMQIGCLHNKSGVEAGIRYDYATKTIRGTTPVALYHNRYVQPQLGKGPALGADAAWVAPLSLADLGFLQLGTGKVPIEISRRYFTYQGKPLVLLHYKVPSFTYVSGGRTIVQWGEGAALTDPGFGQMYWNAALHRAVAQDGGASGRPYRVMKTMGAVDDKGRPLIDPRKVPEVAALIDHFYGASAKEVMPFQDKGSADRTPIALATKIDIMALSIGEDSANQLGEMTGTYTDGNRGAEDLTFTVPGSTDASTATAAAGATASTAAGTVVGVTQIADDLNNLHNALGVVEATVRQATSNYQAAQAAIDAVPEELRATASLSSAYKAKAAAVQALDDEVRAVEASIDAVRAQGGVPGQALLDKFQSAYRRFDAARAQADAMLNSAEGWVVTASPRMSQLLDARIAAAAQLEAAAARLNLLQRTALNMAPALQGLSAAGREALTAALAKLPSAATLNKISNVISGVQIGATITNAVVFVSNGAQGDVPLARTYGAGGIGLLGLELLGIYANVTAGNFKTAATSMAAVVVGSASDIVLSAYALSLTNKASREAEMAYQANRSRQIEQVAARIEAAMASMGKDIEGLDDDLDDIEDSLALARRLAEETRRRREEAERQAAAAAEAERQRLIAAARAENERIYQENLRRPPTQAEWDKFNRDLAEALRPDYPTAPPPDPAVVAERLRKAEEKRLQQALAEAAAAAAEAARIAAEEAERERKRQELADAQDAAQRAREAEEEERRRRNDEAEDRDLEVSPLDTTPVVFEPPVWTPPEWKPPVWEPPVWVPPEFDPPEPSEIPWTDFDDDDYPGGDSNLAYQYDNLSGTVETDLTKWAAWLKTQDERKLTRLALQAGYPNLASALADAHNIIRQSRDTGYRQWALQAPSCGGLIGCGPSYLERWAMKSSIVALGDILNASRDVFSSGGLTDVGISGTRLDYLLRDHGLEDGDIVDVEITQFGRILYSNRISLTNAGQNFTIPLQRGVAGLTIFAVNEGYAIPNTAQVTLDNVVRGEATQQYSLRTGEFATQRIEVGARPEN